MNEARTKQIVLCYISRFPELLLEIETTHNNIYVYVNENSDKNKSILSNVEFTLNSEYRLQVDSVQGD